MVKYPLGHGPRKDFQKKTTKKTITYGSRGMSLEERLNNSNQYYLAHGLGIIHKKPTPIQVVKVDYPKRSAAKITEAYYRHASTTDYNGVYKGFYVDFEAKETRNKTSFPLSNLPEHQRDHMMACIHQGGIAFLIISFTAYDEIFLVPYQLINKYIQENNKQSISYEYIKEVGYICPTSFNPMIDYLKALDNYLETRVNSL
ncbi:Holliday junction resolvase RecU [Aerococcaceae bacterium WGS1372]